MAKRQGGMPTDYKKLLKTENDVIADLTLKGRTND
jgi:hypothetical protein